MIQVFCASRGSGKTKKLIDLANGKLNQAIGDSVYIDYDSRPMTQLKSRIRFINTKEFGVIDCENFYGLLCGVISQNYDIENIYIDGLSNIVNCTISESTKIFEKLREFEQKFKLNLFINMNCDNENDIPEMIREYVA